MTHNKAIRPITYYCGEEFDPRVGQELSAPQWLLRKITAAKALKIALSVVSPFDGVRNRRIAHAIEEWQAQFDEIYGIPTSTNKGETCGNVPVEK